LNCPGEKLQKMFKPGIDVMILSIFSPKNSVKKLAFWFLRKTPFFRQKLSKIAENCDHNIDPRRPNSVAKTLHENDHNGQKNPPKLSQTFST
jgi:hypothetical protein